MHLWNTKALAMEFRDGELPEKERFKYFFIFILLTALLIEVCLYIGEMPTVITIAESAIGMMITVGGTLLAYRTNKGGDNKEFIDRYVCLSIPIMLKMLVLLAICFIAYMIVGYMVLDEAFDKIIASTTWYDVLFTSIFEVLFFWRLTHHVSWASKRQPANKRVEASVNSSA